MEKSATGSIQYLPYIIVQRDKIPPIELNESVFFLATQFNFEWTIENIKVDIINDMSNYVRIIDRLPIKYPLCKFTSFINFDGNFQYTI